MTKELSIVVPCYNESGNIPFIVEQFKKLIENHDFCEVILVDNGSTDDSYNILKRETAESKILILHLETNKGYGCGILSGLEKASGNILAWTHADGQTDPMDVIKAYELYKLNPEEKLIVKGARKNRNFMDAFFSFAMQVFASIVLRVTLDEINAQPKLFSRKFYESYIKEKAPNDFSLDLYLLYMAFKQGSIKNIPVYFKQRIHGDAKGGGSFKGKLNLIKRTVEYIFELAKTI